MPSSAAAKTIGFLIVQTAGDIETFCEGAARAGERVSLYFRTEEDVTPPFKLRVRSPGGVVILERVLRHLPEGPLTGTPSIDFLAASAGEYQIDIKQMQGATTDQDSYRPPPKSSYLPPESVPSKSVPPPNAVPSGTAILIVS